MAVEDWFNLDDLMDPEYWDNLYDPTEEELSEALEPRYTDKFSFNGKRKRTRLQRAIKKENENCLK